MQDGSWECSQVPQNAENDFGFFLEQYQKDGDEFLNHIVQVTDDGTCASFVNAETKEQSKQWLHTHSPNKLKTFKQTFARKLMVRIADGGIIATRATITLEVYCKTQKKNLFRANHSEQRA
jgi:hypothetical protein